MRILASCLVVLLLLGGCSSTSGDDAEAVPGTSPVTRDEAFAALEHHMQQVAVAQDAADESIARLLAAVREVDRIVAGLRKPESVDDARETWSRVDGAMRSATVEGLRDKLFEVAYAVDDARAALAAARQHAEGDWETGYLAAQDELLQAVRDHAQATDELAKALITYWPVYEVLHEETGRFVEQRWFYRSSQEAADAYELAVSDHLNELAAAHREIRRAIEARKQAGEEVTAAQAEVDRRFEERPDDGDPTTSST